MTFKATPWVCSFCLQYEYFPQQFAVDFRIWRDDLHEKGSGLQYSQSGYVSQIVI